MLIPFRTLERFHHRELQGEQQPAAWFVARNWPPDIPYQDPAGEAPVDVFAEVNHGRWIVRCPFCPGAQLASERDHRFYCIDCLHAGTFAEGKWLRVIWPKDPHEIERILDDRPLENRNWLPAEPVSELAAENLEQGVI